MPKGEKFAELVEIMRRLLADGGCPWDREQSLETLKPYLIEEAYEVLEAIDRTPGEHCEELGDLLFQVVFQAALREAAGQFDVDDVAAAICAKLVRRHPHVFGDTKVADSAEVLRNWEAIKAGERSEKGVLRTLHGIPATLPALARARGVQDRAARVGFDWPDAEGPRRKIDEELQELERAEAERKHAELGDLLFAVVNWARKLGLDPEEALRAATRRFQSRFEWIEDRLAEKGQRPGEKSLDELDALWEQAKKEFR
jgi:MazG family protein